MTPRARSGLAVLAGLAFVVQLCLPWVRSGSGSRFVGYELAIHLRAIDSPQSAGAAGAGILLVGALGGLVVASALWSWKWTGVARLILGSFVVLVMCVLAVGSFPLARWAWAPAVVLLGAVALFVSGLGGAPEAARSGEGAER